jgi:flagellar hook protein FlgE
VTAAGPRTFGKYTPYSESREETPQYYRGPQDGAPALDLAILGNGYFIVRLPETDECRATQARHFKIDENGYLLTENGARLQGRIAGDRPIAGDLQISAAALPAGSIPPATMLCYTIDERGKIFVQLSDGAYFVCGQILLQNFEDPQALIDEGNHLYSNMSAAGPLPAMAVPGTNGLGAIQAGVLELAVTEEYTWPE